MHVTQLTWRMTELFSPQKGPSNGKKSTLNTLGCPKVSHKSPQCDGSEVAASGGAQNHVTHGEATAIKVQPPITLCLITPLAKPKHSATERCCNISRYLACCLFVPANGSCKGALCSLQGILHKDGLDSLVSLVAWTQRSFHGLQGSCQGAHQWAGHTACLRSHVQQDHPLEQGSSCHVCACYLTSPLLPSRNIPVTRSRTGSESSKISSDWKSGGMCGSNEFCPKAPCFDKLQERMSKEVREHLLVCL